MDARALLLIVFSHYCRTTNVGDLVSGPYLYFDFEDCRSVHYGTPIPPCDAVIFGGGALGNGIERRAAPVKARVKIAWGIGTTRHGQHTSGPAPKGLDLYGSREWGQEGAVYAPCPSCMSPLFDNPPEPKHEAVFYENSDPAIRRRYAVDAGSLPHADNRTSFADAVAFLASGAVVVTNSYHGAYWATLLGRRVVVVGAYSSKFFAYRFRPAYAKGKDWQTAALMADAYPESLEAERSVSREFHRRVKELLQ